MVECRKTKMKKRKKCNLTQNSYNFTMWRKSKISSFQVSKILIWPYSWNKKHGKFEKFSFTLNFSCFDCIKLWKLKIDRLQVCDFKKIITSYVKKECLPLHEVKWSISVFYARDTTVLKKTSISVSINLTSNPG